MSLSDDGHVCPLLTGMALFVNLVPTALAKRPAVFRRQIKAESTEHNSHIITLRTRAHELMNRYGRTHHKFLSNLLIEIVRQHRSTSLDHLESVGLFISMSSQR